MLNVENDMFEKRTMVSHKDSLTHQDRKRSRALPDGLTNTRYDISSDWSSVYEVLPPPVRRCQQQAAAAAAVVATGERTITQQGVVVDGGEEYQDHRKEANSTQKLMTVKRVATDGTWTLAVFWSYC
jgi:hypothetical protein